MALNAAEKGSANCSIGGIARTMYLSSASGPSVPSLSGLMAAPNEMIVTSTAVERASTLRRSRRMYQNSSRGMVRSLSR